MNLELEHSADGATTGRPFGAELAPLTSDMRRQIYELKAAYEEFWQQRKFKKGWAKPLFACDEAVEELLARAAEMVVRIRSHFDELSASTSSAGSSLSKSTSSIATTKRLPLFKEGRAREYLSSLEQDPRAAPQQFVREIVHATLSNEDGYLEEGLTGDKLDHYIDKISLYMKQRDEQEARATVQLEEKLKRRWAKAEKLLQAFYALDTTEKADRSHYQSLQKIIKHVDDVREELLLMQRRRDVKRAQQSANKAEVPPQAVAVDVEEESERRKAEEKCSAGAEAQPTTESGESEAPAEAKKEKEEEEEEGLVPAEGQQAPTEAEAAGVEEKAEEAVQPLQQVVAQQEEESKVEQTEEGEMSKALEAQPEEREEKNEEKEEEEEEKKKSAQEEEEERQATAAPPTAKDDKALVSKEEEADEESEQRRRIIEQEREKAMLKIKDVAHSVTRLSDQIEGFTSEATKLDMEALQKEPESAEKVLSKLQKQCLVYSENLMKDLLSLDAISTSTLPGSEQASEEVRPLRKQQVKEIQDLLQDVDQVNSKLKAMLKKVQEEKQRKEEQRKKFEMDERAKQPQPPPQPQQQREEDAAEKDQAMSEGKKQPQPQQPGSPKGGEVWRSLKLKPKFEMAQTHDAVVLQAHIPGMREEDIEIERDEDGRSFTVRGLRVPTPAEEAALRRQLKSVLAHDPWGLYYPQGEKERDRLLRMGAGRYGSFSETFEVSPDMDLSGISASYAGGVLRVVVPIRHRPTQRRQPKKAKPAAGPYHGGAPYGAPQRRHRKPHGGGYGGYPQGAPAGGPQGFFNDEAFWW